MLRYFYFGLLYIEFLDDSFFFVCKYRNNIPIFQIKVWNSGRKTP